jgi:two-component system chemotaxis response regulator CheB
VTPPTPVVGIAASAGGPSALAAILPHLVGVAAPVLVVQHLDVRFEEQFLRWMERISALPVAIPEAGVALRPGALYIARQGAHLRLGPRRTVELDPSPPGPHLPSGDQLFLSIAAHAGRAGVGVVLSGRGEDGAAGLRQLRLAGGATMVQDRQTSAVHGMPSAAERLDAVDATLALPDIPAAIRRAVGARAG